MFEDIPSLTPLSLFDLSFNLRWFDGKDFLKKGLLKKYHLLDTSAYLDQDKLEDIYLAWNEEGLFLLADIESEVEKVSKEYRSADSFEIFIDTRALKTAGYISKYSHHFVIYPKKIDNYHVHEVTRFRNEDTHDLVNPKDFEIDIKLKKGGYRIILFIPKKCLYGYDPLRFNKIGFSYRVNRYRLEPTSFSISSKEIKIENSPMFFAEGNLVK